MKYEVNTKKDNLNKNNFICYEEMKNKNNRLIGRNFEKNNLYCKLIKK